MRNQQTIAGEVTLVGFGLHTGKNTAVILRPLPENSGIVVNRTDEAIKFKVTPDAVVSNSRNTTVGNGVVQVHTIEHFMFAFYYFGITNIQIDVNCEELPIFDGSAKEIINAIKKVGLVEQDAYCPQIVVTEKQEIVTETSCVTIEPSDSLEVELTIDFPVEQIGVYTLKYKAKNLLNTIANARTFALLSELNYLLERGLSQIRDINCAYIVKNVLPTEQMIELMMDRFETGRAEVLKKLEELDIKSNNEKDYIPRELASHKMLDFLGDLYLLVGDVKGKFTINKPGHLINGKVAKVLYKV